jgi:DNA-binding transcriptional LysR family regulator
MVEAGLGVTILSRRHTLSKAFKFVARSLDPLQSRKVMLAYRASAQDSPLVGAVAAELKEKSLPMHIR